MASLAAVSVRFSPILSKTFEPVVFTRRRVYVVLSSSSDESSLSAEETCAGAFRFMVTLCDFRSVSELGRMGMKKVQNRPAENL